MTFEVHLPKLNLVLLPIKFVVAPVPHPEPGTHQTLTPANERRANQQMSCGRCLNASIAHVTALSFSKQRDGNMLDMLSNWSKLFRAASSRRCEHCGSCDTKTVGSTQPTQEEKHFGAGNVEATELVFGPILLQNYTITKLCSCCRYHGTSPSQNK